MILKPRPYQVESIEAVEAAWGEGLLRPAVVLPTGAGKAQPTSEPVLTPDGWTTMGRLRVGDYVVGSDGRPTRVTGVFPQGVRPVVRMDFNDGSWTRCDEEHLWSVRTRYDKYEGKPYRTLKASEIRDRIDTGWYVPFVDPVQHPEKNLPLDPYLLGSLIGDGGISGRTILFTGLPDSIEEVRKVLPPSIRLSEDRYSNAGEATSYRLSSAVGCGPNQVLDALRALKLHGATSHTKFIPRGYLESSVEHRTNLLQGLMDTDGYAAGTYLEYTTVSPALAVDVQELVRSLGGRCRLRTKETSWTHNGQKKRGSAFRLTFSLPSSVTPVRLPRKIDKLRARQHEHARKVTQVVSDGYDHCVCISVEAADSLYVTRDHLVTHNTVTFANLIARAGVRTLVLVHRDELAKQAAEKIRSVAPDMNVGIVKADQNETDADVIIGSVQTLFNKNRRDQVTGVELVVVDECHHYVAPAYMEVLEHFGVFENVRAVGYTATMNRADTRGLGDLWEDVVYKKDILWGIINGFLVDVEAQQITIDGFNLAEIARRKGDYQEGKLGEALVNVGAGRIAAKEYNERARGKQGIVFCPTVACADHFLEEFNAAGIPSELVVGTTPIDERQEIYQRYRDRQVQVLVSVMALTEGFDMPQAEVGVMARPTESEPLYQQMAGRLLRLFPGKTKALLLDLVGATSGVSLCGLVNLSNTEVVPQTGETLKEAYERTQNEKRSINEDATKGKVNSRVVELFKQSSSVWLQTPGGYWFVPTKEGYVFLWPYQNGFKVGITGKNSMSGGRMLKDEVLDLPYAMAWGEQLAADIDPSTSQRSASWRKKKQKASDAQLGLAKSLGIKYSEGVRKDEMSDLISLKFASRILDSIKRS